MFECIINVGSSAKNDVQVFFFKKVKFIQVDSQVANFGFLAVS